MFEMDFCIDKSMDEFEPFIKELKFNFPKANWIWQEQLALEMEKANRAKKK